MSDDQRDAGLVCRDFKIAHHRNLIRHLFGLKYYSHIYTKREESMSTRIDYGKVAPGALRAMFGLESYIRGSGLEKSLLDLIRMRASQINGCAYCIDMHSKDARAAGETEQRLYLLDAWREAPFYTERERAALAWTEALTLVAEDHVPDEVFNEVRQHFSEQELANLSLAIVSINAWNRLSIAFRAEPGIYQPGVVAATTKKA
jgi:AhpD family alkylhydroperoxidase